jgi:hypothetical protein
MIWETTGGNPAAVVEFSARLVSGEARGGVSQYLLTQGEYQQAVAVWESIADTDPAQFSAGRSLVSTLCVAGQWPLAHQVWQKVVRKQFAEKGDISSSDLSFWNGSFEHETPVGAFDWSITGNQDVNARRDDSEHHEGNQSLLLEFERHQKVNFAGVTHELWVKPSTRYRLQFYYRTEKVPEMNGLVVALTDAESPARFSMESKPLGNERQWTVQHVQFETPAETRVLRLQILRRPVEQLYDFIKGKVWFDSFNLEEIK